MSAIWLAPAAAVKPKLQRSGICIEKCAPSHSSSFPAARPARCSNRLACTLGRAAGKEEPRRESFYTYAAPLELGKPQCSPPIAKGLPLFLASFDTKRLDCC